MEIMGIAVVSLDGCLTRHDQPGSAFASHEDQAHFRATLASCDATIMGRITFDGERERILASSDPGRLRVVLTRSPHAYRDLERPGALEFTAAPPGELTTALARRGTRRAALLGGGRVYALFADAGLVSRWVITVEPLLFGGGTRLLEGRTDRRLELLESRRMNESGTLLLTYRDPDALTALERGM
ncbi:MAG: dihydrofolate reductase family protein [Spirochaetota bacterium]